MEWAKVKKTLKPCLTEHLTHIWSRHIDISEYWLASNGLKVRSEFRFCLKMCLGLK